MKIIIPYEIGNLDGVVVIILLIMLGPALLLFIIGFALNKSNKKAAKVLFILGGVYLLVSLGTCGAMISGL